MLGLPQLRIGLCHQPICIQEPVRSGSGRPEARYAGASTQGRNSARAATVPAVRRRALRRSLSNHGARARGERRNSFVQARTLHRLFELVCPFGAIRRADGGVMAKCSLCWDRLAEGKQPSCVEACPTKARKLVDANEVAEEKLRRTALTVAGLETKDDRKEGWIN